ncbi:MAG TPA: hypothetical protein PLE78_01630 [Flavobacteriales bacterium]|nr:hypothetical protein [Flavobacteriales bacterium]
MANLTQTTITALSAELNNFYWRTNRPLAPFEMPKVWESRNLTKLVGCGAVGVQGKRDGEIYQNFSLVTSIDFFLDKQTFDVCCCVDFGMIKRFDRSQSYLVFKRGTEACDAILTLAHEVLMRLDEKDWQERNERNRAKGTVELAKLFEPSFSWPSLTA